MRHVEIFKSTLRLIVRLPKDERHCCTCVHDAVQSESSPLLSEEEFRGFFASIFRVELDFVAAASLSEDVVFIAFLSEDEANKLVDFAFALFLALDFDLGESLLEETDEAGFFVFTQNFGCTFAGGLACSGFPDRPLSSLRRETVLVSDLSLKSDSMAGSS